jgi:aryl-alcohol dehydrogenase-like predicted oxidoreductase
MDAVDLLQLHCPHPKVYDRADVFEILDNLVRAGKVRHYGVSVETVGEALRALRHPKVESVQIIFNMFRLKPADAFFAAAAARKVGILARLPLASGLLSGKLRADSIFAPEDHRSFNRRGEAFDKGETFSGIDYQTGLHAVEELRPLTPDHASMAQLALRWILMFPEVTAAIPGGKSEQQVEDNVRAAELPPLVPDAMAQVRSVYDANFRETTHAQW